jgi:malignant T-cell-amplified sequence
LNKSPPTTTVAQEDMFKRFDPRSDVSTSTQVKASVQRSLKAQLLEQHRNLTEEQLDALLPKKVPLVQYKVGPHLMLYCRRQIDQLAEDDEDDGRSASVEPVLFQHRDGPSLPDSRLCHRHCR